MKHLFTIAFLLFSSALTAQVSSPFNQKSIAVDSSGNYSFIVSGHFYGDSYNSTGYPANSLLANLNWMNASGASHLVCLGDLFRDVKNDIPQYKVSLFNELKLPLFNAVGNHDISGNVYQENFGETFYYFQVGSDIHVILDTEINDGSIEGGQLEMLNAIQSICAESKINNVFFYAHRTIWKDTYSEFDQIMSDNTQAVLSNNFESEVLPIVNEISSKSKVFWFAGSIGGMAPASFFYDASVSKSVTYIATAIRGIKRDAVLIVNVKNSKVSFETHSLTGEDLMNLESYDLTYWKENSGSQPFNWRLVPLYIKTMFLHRYFWYGAGCTVLLISLLVFIKNRRAKSRIKPS